MRDDFLLGARAVLDAVSGPSVAAAWDRPSVLAGQTVGGLAGHLARGSVWVVGDYLALDPPATPTFDGAAAYLARIVDLDPADHRAIRERGAAVAAEGPDAVAARLAERVEDLAGRLAVEPADRVVPVFGGAMALDDYLGTRLVEQVVHLDDLARSVPGLEPAVPPSVVTRVARLGLDAAIARHGAPAVVRHLFRPDAVPPGGPAVVPVLG